MPGPPHEQVDLYRELRSRALHHRDDEPGDGVRGLVTDICYEEGVVTIVCLDDGATSMYTNHGGGIIGAGEHEHVAAVTKRVLELAELLVDEVPLAHDEEVPTPGNVTFYFLTLEGLRAQTADEVELDSLGHPLSPLFFAIQDVVSELGRVDPQL
jgi:hypothetical protein